VTARVYCFALCTASRLFQARRHIVRRFIENEMAASRFNYFAPWLAFGDLTLAETLRSVELFAENVMPAFAHRR
jgi:hypothetical protein